MVFAHNPYVTKKTAYLFYSIGSVGWASFASCAFYFSVFFSGRQKILKYKLIHVVLIGLPLVFIYCQWSSVLAATYSRRMWGWAYQWTLTPWFYVFYFYYFSTTLTSFWLIHTVYYRSQDLMKKKQAFMILITGIVALVLATITDVILPRFPVYSIPNVGPSLVLVWAFGIVYAMVKYGFVRMSPSRVADDILASIGDALFLFDRNGQITFMNRAAVTLFGHTEGELKGKGVKVLLSDNAPDQDTVDIIGEGKGGVYDLVFQKKNGEEILAIATSTAVIDQKGQHIGTVCAIKDITQRKKMEQEREQHLKQLEIFFKSAVDREQRIIKLKNEVRELKGRLGEK